MSTLVRWRYRAANADGQPVSGSLDAASADEAVEALRQRALWVIELSPGERGAAGWQPVSAGRESVGTRVTAAASAGWRMRVAGWRSGRDRTELAVLTRAIATLLSAGVPAERAVAYAASGDPATLWAPVFAAVRDAVRGGQSLSEAVAASPEIPAFFPPLLAAAEAAGTLAPTFTMLAEQVERDEAIRQRVTSALIYPVLLGVASTVGTAVILVVVVPRFAALIVDSGGTLPLSTRWLIGASTMLRAGGWAVLAAAVIAGAWWRQSLRDPTRRLAWHARRLRWPLLGAYEQRRAAAAYLGTLSVALQAGVSLLAAMRLGRRTVANAQVASELAVAETLVRDGRPVAVALDGVLPPLAVRLLEAGEASGALATLARRAAEAAGEEAERALMRAVTLIEPVMILGFGGVVALVALALLQAIYGLNAGTL